MRHPVFLGERRRGTLDLRSALIGTVAGLVVGGASLAFAAPRGGGVVPGPVPAPPPPQAPGGTALGGSLAALLGDWGGNGPTAKGSGPIQPMGAPIKGAVVKAEKNPGYQVVDRKASGQPKPDILFQSGVSPANPATGAPEVNLFAVLQIGEDGASVTMWCWTNFWIGPAVLTGTATPGVGYVVSGPGPKGGAVTVKATLQNGDLVTDFQYTPPAGGGGLKGPVSNRRSNPKEPPS
ncbi:MAG: hypothetical protein IT460_15370 [Planctomycetes bacterium]|nr:hypothetical protein [Planctomycetota bacterium]